MIEIAEVVITAPDPEWLLNLTRLLVSDKLCASAHNFEPVKSVYWWDGQVRERREGRASLHTRGTLVRRIAERVAQEHPYAVPSVSSRPITDGHPDYLRWVWDTTEGYAV